MRAKKSDNSKQHVQHLDGLSSHAACEVGGEGANAPSPRPSRRNIVCLILYMSLIVVNID